MTERATAWARSYLDAAATFAELIARVEPAANWGAHGLGVWDLRSLVGHTSRALVTVSTYLEQPADAETITSPEQYFAMAAGGSTDAGAIAERGRQAGLGLGAHPARVIAELVNDVRTKLRTTNPERVIAVMGGGIRVGNYLPTRTFEIVVHSFDISAATGVEVTFTPTVLADAAALAARAAAAVGQGRTVLSALTGRGELPKGFSIVG